MKNRVVLLVLSIFAVFISIVGSMFLASEIRRDTPDKNYYIEDNVTAKRVFEYADGIEFNDTEAELYMVTVEITNNTACTTEVTFPPFNIKDGDGYFANCSRWGDYQIGSNNMGHGAYILPGATLVKSYYFETRNASDMKLLYNSQDVYMLDEEKCTILDVNIEN